MGKANFTSKANKFKVGPQHIFVWCILIALFFSLMQFKLVPWATETFIVSLFKPSGDQLLKIGFVKFNDNVYASCAKDREAQFIGKNLEISREATNKEFIFDFSFEQRTEAQNGYVKGANEFYVRSPILGESAIILEPWICFWLISLVISIIISTVITMFMPSGIGFLAVLVDRQIDNTKVKLRLQTGFSDDIVELLTMPDDKLSEKEIREVRSAYRLIWDRTVTEDVASPYQSNKFEDVFDDETDIVMFRNEALYTRLKEFFSDFVAKEILDTKNALLWRRNRSHFFKGLRLYMSHHVTEKYANLVTGLAYGGAAVLVVTVGIRGIKFIPAQKPSFILLSIILEGTMLSLLAFTLVYTEEEERMDKMLKKMEDANRSSLEALRGQQADIHQLSNALVGQTAEIIRTRVEKAIEQYMTSGDKVQEVVASEIAKRIMVGLREEKSDDYRR